MMIILPSILSNAQNTLASLTVSQLEQYLNFKHMEVALQIPKFAIKADTDLTPVLKQVIIIAKMYNLHIGKTLVLDQQN